MNGDCPCRQCPGQAVPPCCLLEDSLRRDVVLGRPQQLAPGATIKAPGALNASLGLILSGKVALDRPADGTLCTLAAGDIVGDLFASRAILGAHAIDAVTLCWLDRMRLIGAIDRSPGLLRFFLAGTQRWLAAVRG